MSSILLSIQRGLGLPSFLCFLILHVDRQGSLRLEVSDRRGTEIWSGRTGRWLDGEERSEGTGWK